MPESTPAATEDRQGPAFLTPETAGPLLEDFLFPAPADQKESAEQPAAAETAEAETATTEATGETQEAEEAAESAEAPDAQSQETSQPPVRKVRLDDGSEREVQETELEEAYRRKDAQWADYTRKTQALAEERKAFLAEQESVRAERQRYAARLKELDEALKPPAVDWDAIQREHPDQFPTLWANYQRLESERQRAAQERAEAEAKVRADWEVSMKDQMAKQRELLLAAVPEWRDAEKAKADSAALVAYAKSIGFTDQEIQLTDHRIAVALRDAAFGASIRKTKPQATKVVESKIKTAKPGSAGTVKPKVDADVALADRFQRSGRIQDAAAIFEKLF